MERPLNFIYFVCKKYIFFYYLAVKYLTVLHTYLDNFFLPENNTERVSGIILSQYKYLTDIIHF